MTTDTPKPLIFSAFVMNTPSHIMQGTWHLPGSTSTEFNSAQHWIDLAKLLEKGRFDFIFFADVIGLYGDYRGDYRKYVETGLQVPSNDPSVLASALAVATEHLGIAFTSSIVQEHPFNFARRVSTLDHLSGGRIAWNIVTSHLENSFRNFGHPALVAHDERYVWAEEYLDVLLKLWEGSWEEDAVLADAERGVYADFDKVHKIFHKGDRYEVEGPHLVAPSPQRTPLLFQAGSSPAGRDFAARNAEATFIAANSPETARAQIIDTRQRAAGFGRNPDDIKFFPGLSFVIGSTEDEARRKEAELEETLDWDGHLAHMSGSMGVDLGHHDLDAPVGNLNLETVQSLAGMLQAESPDKEVTVRDLVRWTAGSNRLVGTPEQIADQLEVWRDAGIDGVNVINVTRPGTYVEFIEHVTPVLQERGLQRREYDEGTLRHKVFGADRLPESHRGAGYRGAFGRSEIQ
ncbi:LLM class flavin-dependent oxidoreductase [Nocardioides sp. W7]|uniref:LLM class flavin-dependent oxidoreductase n=1 Tax=Nocardioides sp. W7 TaxID=2931390 RepID=UPI001FD45016|nr:LLM class flavin-dependent oxidoreductase [Nocardioides sp. W7]